MTLISSPAITDSVNQTFFIEALGGSQNPVSYLDRFPETVYTKAIDSLLVKFLYALVGPVGVGLLRQEYLEARLQVEQAGLNTADIDSLYTNAFGFARLAEETYQLDAAAGLLSSDQRAMIESQDASFRNRAIDFLKGARAGGTLLGAELVARSGLDRPVEVVENYRALYDRYADLPLDLPYFGQTSSTAEIVVVPRQINPQSSVQTLTLSGQPRHGWFTLTFPRGQNWQAVPVTSVAGSNILTVPAADLFAPGAFVTLTTAPPNTANPLSFLTGALYAVTGSNLPNTTGGAPQVSLLYPPSAGNLAGRAAPAPANGNFLALAGNAQTVAIPYNATAAQVQDALVALPLIGTGNVVVTGGPLPDRPIVIQFAKGLSDQTVPQLQPNLAPDAAIGVTAATTGGAEQLSDVNTSPLTIGALVEMTTAGISADGQVTTIAPADEYAMQLALDQTLPLTTLVTTRDGNGPTVRQPHTAFTGAPQAEVLDYVTGRPPVHWPPRDPKHWIEPSKEHEAPRGRGHRQQHHRGFHHAQQILAYVEAALLDRDYATSTDDLVKPFWNSLIGNFSPAQRALVPGLQAFSDPAAQYVPTYALAPEPKPLVITADTGSPMINDSYPIDYYSLPGVEAPTKVTLWASMERPSGTDYLEIDLGTPQAVNYLYFEATRKPFLIDVAYDTLDQAPSRSFMPVTVAPATLHQSLTSLTYDNAVTNMWQTGEIFFTNALGTMIYTRFLRIGFTRAPIGTPFAPTDQTIIPYSIEVRNLRIGRNVSGPNATS